MLYKYRRLIIASGIIAGLWLLFEVWALIVSASPTEVVLSERLLSPSIEHWFGTDDLGRDILSRTAYGARLSFRVSIIAWFASLSLGLFLGGIAGYWEGSLLDRTISWCTGALFIMPYMIIIIAALSVLGPGLENAYLVLTFIAWAAPARMTRINVIKIKTQDFVRTAHAMGFSPLSIILKAILPAVIPTVLIASVGILPELIALDAGLSFFGLGVRPPAPSLGKMIVDGLSNLSLAWWIALAPTFALGLICISVNIAARILRNAT